MISGKKEILLAIVILFMTSAGLSDEHEEENEPTGTEPVAAQTQAPGQPGAQTQVEDTETFVPTETISEDLSVPFPVDI